MNRKRVARLLMAAGVAVSTAGTAQGQTTLAWNSPGDGFWAFSGNWLPIGIPDATSEIASLGLTVPYTVNLNNSYSIRGLTITNPLATLLIPTVPATGRSLTLDVGGLFNDGLVRLEGSAATGGTLLTFNQPATIGGTGEIRLEEAGAAEVVLNLSSGLAVTHGPGHRITGAGVVRGSSNLRIINQGEIRGDRAGGLRIGVPVDNSGLMHAVPGGSLEIDSNVLQVEGGEIVADGADVLLRVGTITGGVLRSENGGVFRGNGSSISWTGLRFEGEAVIATMPSFSASLGITGTGIENRGRIVMREDPVATLTCTLQLQAPAVLSGDGEVVLDVDGDPNISTSGSGGQVVNGPEHTIRGSGTISGNARLLNEGLIQGDISGAMVFSSITVDNRSLIRAVQPGAVVMGATLIQSFGAGGVLEADGADVTLQSSIAGGVVRGVNGGRILVNSSTATLTGGVKASGEWWLIPAASQVTLAIGVGGMVNDGLIRLRPDNSTAANVRLQINERITLEGGGEVRLEEADDAELYISLSTGLAAFNGPAHRITGTGAINSSTGAKLINQGIIDANAAGGLAIAPAIENRGLMRATGPGLLRIGTQPVTQTFTGVIEADGGTVLLPASSSITGGTVQTINGGVIRINGASSINGVRADGEWRVEPALTGATMTVGALGIVNDGVIRLMANPASPQDARLQIDDLQPLRGSGEVRLEEPIDSELYLNLAAGFVVTNGPGHRISGVGRITGTGATLRNEGTLAPGVGAGVGTLVSAAPIVLAGPGALEIGIAGTSLLARDVLDVTASNATLGGTLRVRMVDDFEMPPCQTFEVMRGPVSGVFNVLDLEPMPQGVMAVEYRPDGVWVSYTPGDLTGDALLDYSDYLEFLNVYDAGDLAADFNQDGVVDFADFLEFFNVYEVGC